MLKSEIIKKIEDFVYSKPRSVQEIAEHIDKNWRTADRYIEEIEKEYGTISTRVFRGGTRGALKIVFWSSIEKASNSVFQEEIQKEIMIGRSKFDFSPFDIYQFIDAKKKSAKSSFGINEKSLGLLELKSLLLSAEKQILFFSGNLSLINYKDSEIDIFRVLEELVKKEISLKVVCRIDLAGIENVERLLSLNSKYGKELVEIHHKEQPLRAILVDNKIFNIKEVKEPTGREKELNKKLFIFYNIYDKVWVEWLSRIFWKMFSSSIDAHKRLAELKTIKAG